jgi:hypothetical protein
MMVMDLCPRVSARSWGEFGSVFEKGRSRRIGDAPANVDEK